MMCKRFVLFFAIEKIRSMNIAAIPCFATTHFHILFVVSLSYGCGMNPRNRINVSEVTWFIVDLVHSNPVEIAQKRIARKSITFFCTLFLVLVSITYIFIKPMNAFKRLFSKKIQTYFFRTIFSSLPFSFSLS